MIKISLLTKACEDALDLLYQEIESVIDEDLKKYMEILLLLQKN